MRSLTLETLLVKWLCSCTVINFRNHHAACSGPALLRKTKLLPTQHWIWHANDGLEFTNSAIRVAFLSLSHFVRRKDPLDFENEQTVVAGTRKVHGESCLQKRKAQLQIKNKTKICADKCLEYNRALVFSSCSYTEINNNTIYTRNCICAKSQNLSWCNIAPLTSVDLRWCTHQLGHIDWCELHN